LGACAVRAGDGLASLGESEAFIVVNYRFKSVLRLAAERNHAAIDASHAQGLV
jgi:hypothetical protein